MANNPHNYVLDNGIVSKNSHSLSYSFITYWTAYLKTHYPREYMSVLCSYASDDLNDTAFYLGEARRMGLKVYPPDLNSSELSYSVEEDGIRIGLGTLRNLGEGSALEIIEHRKEREFDSLYDFALRVNPNVRAFKSLAYSGALDAYGSRRGIVSVASDILDVTRKDAKKVGQGDLFGGEVLSDFRIPATEYAWEEYLNHEKATMGIYASGHPLDGYTEYATGTTVSDLRESAEWSNNKVLAIVSDVKLKYTKAQDPMAEVIIEDQTGAVSVVVFPKMYQGPGRLLTPGTIWVLSLRTSTDFRDEQNFVLSDAERVESKTTEASDEKFGVHLPKGFNRQPKFMGRLKGIFLEHSGDVSVEVFISRSTQIKLDNTYLVERTDDLKNDIKDLFLEYQAGSDG